MNSQNQPLGDNEPEWADPDFNSFEYNDQMNTDSPFGANGYTDFNYLNADSPAFAIRSPLNAKQEAAQAAQANSRGTMSSTSAESSSQDSSSDSSSRRKRKNTSESPNSDPIAESGYSDRTVKKEGILRDMNSIQQLQNFDQTFSTPMNNLSLEQDQQNMFDFQSAASSPTQMRTDYESGLSLNAQMKYQSSHGLPDQFTHEFPVRTVNPSSMFSHSASRDQSPATANMMYGQHASPSAMFSTPSSDSNDQFTSGQTWNGMPQNPAWPNDYSNQFTSPGGLGLTPSPVVNGATPISSQRATKTQPGRSPLHIAPIATKSRVETQINVIMTLEKPPPCAEYLHLPLHTIAKSKLLAKEPIAGEKTLELYTMLVCTSAMKQPHLKQIAMEHAAAQDNVEVRARAEAAGEDEKKDNKDVDEVDKPTNGGEVRICQNCINRERKRAGRKKLKKEEEQEHWQRYETERVVVFNSNEYLQWKAWEPASQTKDGPGGIPVDDYIAPEGSICVTAAMRIACYCRHQSEKDGFRVIFTMKDHAGHVVAQQMSDSILITDDHKTHPPSFSATMPGGGYYENPGFPPAGMPTSYSMVDLQTHMSPLNMSRSTGNLQALGFGGQFNPHSHIHQLPTSGVQSQATSTTMTPNNLSRPASPTSAGQAGPNKKRKSSTFHRRVPSGLTMTPRVDTSQPPLNSVRSGMSMTSPFSPSSAAFCATSDHPYINLPYIGGQAQYHGSGSPTPNENAPFNFNAPMRNLQRETPNYQAFYSAPSSAHQSRASSPVQQSGPNLAAYARQQMHPQSSMNTRQAMFAAQGGQANAASDLDQLALPMINKVIPADGPTSGGQEISIHGSGFYNGIQVMFGEHLATATTFWSEKSLLCVVPPGRTGPVSVTLVPSSVVRQHPSLPPMHTQVYTYKDDESKSQMMEMALRFISQKTLGSADRWQHMTQANANAYMAERMGRGNLLNQGGYDGVGGNTMASDVTILEDCIMYVIDKADMCDSSFQPNYELRSNGGQTILSLACSLGLFRVVAALLARGANPDTRDTGGYTPLMHAALHGRAKIFQLLVVKGADPTIRSLRGHAATDFAPSAALATFQNILLNTRRTRTARPPLLTNLSSNSVTSKGSWDIGSASYYESEADDDQSPRRLASLPASRRSSAAVTQAGRLRDPELESKARELSLPAGMVAWRNSLASQIHHFQQNLHWNMSNFQLPNLPPLPDYQDSAMARRITALVPGRTPWKVATPLAKKSHVIVAAQQPGETRFWDFFGSASSFTAPPPPAYADLFPDEAVSSAHKAKTASAIIAAADAVADLKCAQLFDTTTADESTARSNPTEAFAARYAKQQGNISYYLKTLLLTIIVSMMVQLLMPYIGAGVSSTMRSVHHQTLTA